MNQSDRTNPGVNRSSRSHSKRRRAARRRRRILTVFITILLLLSLLLILGGAYIWQLLGKVHYVKDSSQSYVDSLEADPMDPDFSGPVIDDPVDINDAAKSVGDIAIQKDTKTVTNILLLGVETGNENNYVGRSDSMIILTINKYAKTIKMTSLLRDMYVSIPNHGYNKLNAAFAFGGFDLLSQTIKNNFRIQIDKFVAVNFSAFSKAVDAMGGIDLTLTADEAKEAAVGQRAGSYHLNGDQALAYARIRHFKDSEGNQDDWGRTNRQRTVIQKLMEKAKTMGIPKLNSLLNQILPEVSTNMSQKEFTSYALNATTYLGYAVSQYYMPHYGDFDTLYVKGIGEVLALKDSKTVVLDLQHQIYGDS